VGEIGERGSDRTSQTEGRTIVTGPIHVLVILIQHFLASLFRSIQTWQNTPLRAFQHDFEVWIVPQRDGDDEGELRFEILRADEGYERRKISLR
jgi:hypothetical protein